MYNITEELKATLSFSMWLFIRIIEYANSDKIINRTNKKKKLTKIKSFSWGQSLSPLEVKDLNSIDEDKKEEENPTKMSQCNISKEVVVIAQKLLKVFLHWDFAMFRDMDQIHLVTNLRCHKSVDCPGHWRTPVVPPPPNRNLLRIQYHCQELEQFDTSASKSASVLNVLIKNY